MVEFDEDAALGEMVAAGIFFLFDTQDALWEGKDEEPRTISLGLNCNDLFYWACADWEPVTLGDLPDLYRRFKDNSRWGATQWACVKRNLAPQVPIVNDMEKDGAWTTEMESLPRPKPS